MAKHYEVRIESHLDELNAETEAKIRQWLSAVGEDGVSVAQEIIDRNHRVDTGRMRASVTHNVEEDELAVIVGTGVDYGLWNEIGTSRMAGIHFIEGSLTLYLDKYKEWLEARLSEL